MMIDVARCKSKVLIAVAVSILARSVHASEGSREGVANQLTEADAIAIVQLDAASQPGEWVRLRVLKNLKDAPAAGEEIWLLLPRWGLEQMGAPIDPHEGAVWLAFLRHWPHGGYVAATALRD